MSARSVTLYIFPGASSLFPHILFHYAGIPFTPCLAVPTDPDMLAMNPKAQVPVLVLDGFVLTENPAIAHAVNQLASDKQIMGRNDREFLRACEWLNWISATLHAQAWGPYVLQKEQSETFADTLTESYSYVRPWRFTTDKAGEAAVQAACKQMLLERFDMLESKLDADGPWALGEHFTAVDAFVYYWFRSTKGRMGIDMAKYPRWTRVSGRVEGMEAVKNALAVEEEMRASAPT